MLQDQTGFRPSWVVRESQVQAQVLLLGPHRRLVRDASQVLSGGAALDEVQLHLRFLEFGGL